MEEKTELEIFFDKIVQEPDEYMNVWPVFGKDLVKFFNEPYLNQEPAFTIKFEFSIHTGYEYNTDPWDQHGPDSWEVHDLLYLEYNLASQEQKQLMMKMMKQIEYKNFKLHYAKNNHMEVSIWE